MKTGQLNYGKLRLLSLTEMGLFCARWAFSEQQSGPEPSGRSFEPFRSVVRAQRPEREAKRTELC